MEYRISVKEAIRGQLRLMELVKGILEKKVAGTSLHEALTSIQTEGSVNLGRIYTGQVSEKVALRPYLLYLK